MRPATIAIDGPAASGKSTLGYYIAQYLNYLYLDTGVLYRAVTWAALNQKVAIADEAAITTLAQELDITVSPKIQNHHHEEDGRQYTVTSDGQDITWAIRTPEVDGNVSPVSVYPGVREALTRRMREIAAQGKVVMVGRDIGTVVIPDADLKLYVIASAEERAKRRYEELLIRGKRTTYEAVLNNIRQRDKIDSGREAAPLCAAEDAVEFDTTAYSKAEMFKAIIEIVENWNTQGNN
ncbi:MAG: (d)CMP kinase [Anaerolineae bacterium]|nr:(d)CMP kinase [Anaerolineae bacterium]